MRNTTYILLGVLLALCGTIYAADITVAGAPAFKDGALWARKSGTTNTKQDVTSTGNALDVNIASGSPTPPTGASATQVQGTAADGAAAVGSPVQTGGVDGSGNAQALSVDTTGRTVVVGAAAVGGGASGNPVYVAGKAGNGVLYALPVTSNGTAQVAGDGIIPIGGAYTNNAGQPAVTTAQAVTAQFDAAGNIRTAPQRPTATDILAGYATVTASTTTTTLITVSAGRTWVGTLCASVDGNKAAAATGNGLVNATFLTTGTNVVPAAGTYFGVSTSIGANAATGTVGTQGSNQGCTPFTTVAPAGNTTTINYVTTCTNTTACAVHVSAIGVMQ